MIEIQVPEAAKSIIRQLNDHGFEAFVVGGCVRDSLLGRVPEDWDITTSASPTQVKEIFARTVDTGIQHGTVTVLIDRCGYEVTTYRIDGEYEDGRHPKNVEFTGNLLEDLKRRDFTINAMAYSDREGLIDAFGGIKDLKDRMIRCVGNANDRFSEDALRILRAIRFSAQLDFDIERETKKGICHIAPNMIKVSKERVQVELTKLLLSEHPERVIEVYESGISPYISEHFKDAGSRLSHLEKVSLLPVKKHVRWSGFLRMENAADASEILRELKMDNDTIHQTEKIVSLWREKIPVEKAEVRRLMSHLPLELFNDLLDFWGIFCKEEDKEQLMLVRRSSEEILSSGDCIHLKDLAITGRDLLETGRRPGPEIGKILDRLFQVVLEDPQCNRREILLEMAESM